MTHGAHRLLWTDGSSLGNPGPGGWATLVDGLMYSGRAKWCTNNEAEMMAVYHGISNCNAGDDITVCTDSELIIGWMTRNYACNNETVRAYKRVIDTIVSSNNLKVTFVKVQGHSGLLQNEQVDRRAKSEATKAKSELYSSVRPSASS